MKKLALLFTLIPYALLAQSVLSLHGGVSSGGESVIELKVKDSLRGSGVKSYMGVNFHNENGHWRDKKREYMIGYEVMFGYQFGTPIGDIAILPLGISSNSLSLENYHSIKVYHYNVGVGYQDDITYSLCLRAKIIYNHTLGTLSDNKYLLEYYKPSGYTSEVELNYALWEHFGISLKGIYEDQEDDGVVFKKGFTILGGINYRY